MLITKEVKITTTGVKIKEYKDLGYNCQHGSEIIIPIEQLSLKSGVTITYKCDYCNENFNIRYSDYTKRIGKDCCKNCSNKKLKEVFNEKYGVNNAMELESSKEKLKKTNLDKYGVTSALKNPDVMKKLKQTNLDKYGVENVFENKDFQEKQKNTVLNTYGVENVFSNDEIKEKIKNTFVKLWSRASYEK